MGPGGRGVGPLNRKRPLAGGLRPRPDGQRQKRTDVELWIMASQYMTPGKATAGIQGWAWAGLCIVHGGEYAKTGVTAGAAAPV